MPDLNVCTGRAFGVGTLGELEPANLRSVAWPFSASPATAAAQMQAANGLRYDQSTAAPGGGMWVAQVCPKQVLNSQSGTPGTSLAASSPVNEVTLTNVAFTNPSSLQTMVVLATVTWAAVLASGAQPTELWAAMTIGGTSSLGWAVINSDGGSAVTSVSKTYNASRGFTFTVPPGSTVQMTPRLGVHNLSTTTAVTFTSWAWSVAAVAVLLDPTTAG